MHNVFVLDTKTVTHPDTDRENDKQTTVRIPKELRVRAATAAAEHDTTLNQLLVEGLEMRLAQLEGTR